MALLAWLGALGTAIAEYFGRKGFAVIVYGSVFVALLSTYYLAMQLSQTGIQAISSALAATSVRNGGPSIDWFSMVGQFVPANFVNCTLLIIQAWATRAALILTMRYVDGVMGAQ